MKNINRDYRTFDLYKNQLQWVKVLLSLLGLSFILTMPSPALAQEDASAILSRLEPAGEGLVEVIIDTDTYNEIDDQFAVVYALLAKERLHVNAIYAAPFLNTRSESAGDGMEKSHEEILRLLSRMDVDPQDFVFKGSDRFMIDNNDQPVSSDATQHLINHVKNAEGLTYVVTLGAPTNVSSAIMLAPEIKDKIVVVWLGGKAHYWSTATEFNLMQDLKASQVLFDSGVPLVQIPTNPVTSHLMTSLPEIEKYLKDQGAIGHYLYEIYEDYYSDHYAKSKVIWDISAVAYLLNEKWFNTTLVQSPILTSEMTYSVDRSRHFIRVVNNLHRDPIFGDMFKRIQDFVKK